MHQITLFPEFFLNVLGRGINPVGRKTPLPTPIRTYGASILGLIAPTELDTRHPFRKSCIRHCELPTNLQNFTQKDLTAVNIFLKVLEGVGYYFETPCGLSGNQKNTIPRDLTCSRKLTRWNKQNKYSSAVAKRPCLSVVSFNKRSK